MAIILSARKNSKGGTLMSNYPERQEITQILKDAGCTERFISQIISLIDINQGEEVFELLREWRNHLMDEIHSSQHKLDCLDYLIRKMKK